jgi:hypothetical protein
VLLLLHPGLRLDLVLHSQEVLETALPCPEPEGVGGNRMGLSEGGAHRSDALSALGNNCMHRAYFSRAAFISLLRPMRGKPAAGEVKIWRRCCRQGTTKGADLSAIDEMQHRVPNVPVVMVAILTNARMMLRRAVLAVG